MKKFKHIIIVSCLSCLLFACSKMQVIESDNISRTVKFIYNNGDIKIINQKFNYKYSTWISAECVAKNIDSFNKCPKDKIDYTKFGKMQIAHLEDQSLKESKYYVQTESSEEASSTEDQESSGNEEETSNTEEETSNTEEEHTEQEHPEHEYPPLPPMECNGGPEVC